jgi:hypothetical protein
MIPTITKGNNSAVIRKNSRRRFEAGTSGFWFTRCLDLEGCDFNANSRLNFQPRESLVDFAGSASKVMGTI